MRPWLKTLADSAPKYLFVASLCLVSLLYGIVAGRYEWFPFPLLRDAKSGAKAVLDAVREEQAVAKNQRLGSPVVVNHADVADDALILVSGGPGYLNSYHPDGCLAWLMNRQGQVVHVWKYDPQLWADVESVTRLPGLSEIIPVGLHLMENGDLIVSFQGTQTWPYGIGIARLDKDSNVIWQNECNAHHWFTITPDEKILTPTQRVVKAPQRIGTTGGQIDTPDGEILEDFVTLMTLDGEIIEQHSMLDAIAQSGLVGVFQGASHNSANVTTDDPLHLNSVRRVGERVAAEHESLEPDDLLVSFRSINMIGIIDHKTRRFKWTALGRTLRQHCPMFLDGKRMLVFDNLGGNAELGGTRLAQLAFDTRVAETVFPKEPNSALGEVYTYSAGHLNLNHDRTTVLMTITNDSRLLEVSLEDGKPLWEYQHADSVPTRIYTAKLCYDVSFELNQRRRDK